MTCTPIVQNGVTVGFICERGRRSKPKRCACGATATLLCDGRVPGVVARTRRCDAPICAACAREVGEDRHHCPNCVAVERDRMASVLPEDDGLVAYTDGSGTIATRPCGAGVVVFDGRGAILEVSKHLGNGTNNYAELSAIRLALAVCGVVALQRRPLLIRTDSMYCIDSLTSAYDAHPMAPNAELINVIRDRMAKRGHVDFEHVKGHRGEPGNERADVLAGLARLRVPGQRELLP